MALARGAAGVDVEQLGRAVAHLFGRLALGFFPLAAAQLVQRSFVGTHAGVAADELQLAYGHIQHRFTRVLQVQKLLQGRGSVRVFVAYVHVDEAPIAADAVRAVHDGVAHIELGEVLDQCLDIAHLFLLLAAARGRACGKKLGLGDEIDAFLHPLETCGERRRGDTHFFIGTGLEFSQRVKGGWIQARGTQEVEQAFAPPGAFCQQKHTVRRVANVGVQPGQRVFCAAHHGQVGVRLEVRVVDHIVHTWADGQLRVRLAPGVELVGAQEQGFGWQYRAFGVALQQTVAVTRVLPETLKGRFQVAVQNHGGGIAQVVKHRGGFVKEQRQVVLDTGRGDACAHVLVDAALGGVSLQQLAPAGPKTRPGRFIHGEFAPG